MLPPDLPPAGWDPTPSDPLPPEVAPAPVPAAPAPGARRAAPRPPAQRRESLQGGGAVVQTALVMIAILSTWVAGQLLVFSGVSHDREQTVLYRDFRTQLAETTAPLGPVVEPGAPVALLQIPAIGVEEVVVEGTASGDLLAGPGHRRDTVLPGQVGVSLVYGRAATYGAPFRDLDQLEPGDVVGVVSAQGSLHLTVIGLRREGDPLPPPPADGVTRLTLTTAQGEGFLGRFRPTDLLFVDAEATDGFAAPPGRPTAVPDSEKAMASDPGGRPLLALWLALLIGLTCGVVAARQRFRAALVWVVASPLALTLAWLTTDSVMRLLPNLM